MKRCIGCGKKLASGKAFRIHQGLVEEGVFYPTEEFGVLHLSCFYSVVNSPEAVLEALRIKAGEPPLSEQLN